MFSLEIVLRQQGQHLLDVYDVLCQGLAMYHNIVKVYNNEFAFRWLQDYVGHAHILTRCVC
jgi:hypothetical protein